MTLRRCAAELLHPMAWDLQPILCSGEVQRAAPMGIGCTAGAALQEVVDDGLRTAWRSLNCFRVLEDVKLGW